MAVASPWRAYNGSAASHAPVPLPPKMTKAIGSSPTAFEAVPGRALIGLLLTLRVVRIILARTPGSRGCLASLGDGHLLSFRSSPFVRIDAVAPVLVHHREGGVHLWIELRLARGPLSAADRAVTSVSQALKPPAQSAAAGVAISSIIETKAAQYLVIAFVSLTRSSIAMISSPIAGNGPADVFRQPRKGGPSFEAESRANLPNPA